MNVLEDALAPHVENGGFATLAMVSTGDGVREWVYYAEDSDAFVERLNVALTGLAPFPIDIYDAQDPSWSYYFDFISGLQGEATPL